MSTPEMADRAAVAHLARIATAQQCITEIEADLDSLHRQTSARKREHGAAVKTLRELNEQAAGIQALSLPFDVEGDA